MPGAEPNEFFGGDSNDGEEMAVSQHAMGDTAVTQWASTFPELVNRDHLVDRGLILVQTNLDNINLVDLYERELGSLLMNSLRSLVQGLYNVRVAHINATSFGGGVAELLHRQIPLMNQLGESVGFHTDWYILNVDNPAFYDTRRSANIIFGLY
jgi:trehalose synthase